MSLKLVKKKKLPPAVVVFLLNSERVLAEMSELAKAHIAELLKVEPDKVLVDFELAKGGKIIPTFKVDLPDAGPIEKKYIQEGIAEVWLGWAKQELVDRLRGLGEVRGHGATETDTGADSSPEKEESGEALPE